MEGDYPGVSNVRLGSQGIYVADADYAVSVTIIATFLQWVVQLAVQNRYNFIYFSDRATCLPPMYSYSREVSNKQPELTARSVNLPSPLPNNACMVQLSSASHDSQSALAGRKVTVRKSLGRLHQTLSQTRCRA